ncbi:MAG: TSUP family transporter, partial [Solimonas sp.]
LSTVLHFPIHIATATSQFTLAFMAAQGTAVHLGSGTLSPSNGLTTAVLLAIGAVPGAQLGALASRRVHSSVITKALAVALVLVGLRLGLKAAGIV